MAVNMVRCDIEKGGEGGVNNNPGNSRVIQRVSQVCNEEIGLDAL